jgi:hypothetical protein
VGDVVEVFQDSSGNTLPTDVGITGTVLKLYNDSMMANESYYLTRNRTIDSKRVGVTMLSATCGR